MSLILQQPFLFISRPVSYVVRPTPDGGLAVRFAPADAVGGARQPGGSVRAAATVRRTGRHGVAAVLGVLAQLALRLDADYRRRPVPLRLDPTPSGAPSLDRGGSLYPETDSVFNELSSNVDVVTFIVSLPNRNQR